MIDSDFRWATGIECSFIPHLGIDQYRWTQHDRFWRQDFELIGQDLGCRWLRYALPWHEIERQPGTIRLAMVRRAPRPFRANWASTCCSTSRISARLPGCPTPSRTPDFPAALERFARAFGERYAGRVPMRLPDQRTAHHVAFLRRHRPVASVRARVEQLHDRAFACRPGPVPRRASPARNDARRRNSRLAIRWRSP